MSDLWCLRGCPSDTHTVALAVRKLRRKLLIYILLALWVRLQRIAHSWHSTRWGGATFRNHFQFFLYLHILFDFFGRSCRGLIVGCCVCSCHIPNKLSWCTCSHFLFCCVLLPLLTTLLSIGSPASESMLKKKKTYGMLINAADLVTLGFADSLEAS